MLAPAARIVTRDPIEELVAEGRHRDAVALCVRQHGAAVGRLCMALLGSQPDAEEVLQETMLAAYAQMGSWRGEGTVRAWLFGIARRQCARRYELGVREQRRLRVVPHAGVESPAISPELSVEAMRQARAVRAALAALKPSEREALILHYQGELSFREIAELCGIDEAAARKRASRGLARLRKTLTPDAVEG
jgi:RNA polymerase sigma-70 factor (ECF subfamily)